MRRFISSIGITLLALTLSGWGNVMAAAFCPHAGANQAQSKGEEHSHCAAKAEMREAHHSASEHQEMRSMKMQPAALHGDEVTIVLSRPAGSCAHCVSQSDFPATLASARELILKKNDAGADHQQPLRLAASVATAFTPHLIPTQHAPPGTVNHRHLLFSVFLI